MKDKLTENELLKRLDSEFPDVDFQIHTATTRGVVATVYFYEDKLTEIQPTLTRGQT